jgi:hypothetical protein
MKGLLPDKWQDAGEIASPARNLPVCRSYWPAKSRMFWRSERGKISLQNIP